jgi:transketolase C-terminal domain/subunit
VLTVEEGYAVGGLGSLVAETLTQNDLKARLCIKGIKTPLLSLTGETNFMRQQYGLDANSLADAAEELILVRRMAA